MVGIIRMIKLCGKSITYPLKLLFEASLQEGTFPSCWKKANVVPVHKKKDKHLLKDYRPTADIGKNIRENTFQRSI